MLLIASSKFHRFSTTGTTRRARRMVFTCAVLSIDMLVLLNRFNSIKSKSHSASRRHYARACYRNAHAKRQNKRVIKMKPLRVVEGIRYVMKMPV